MNQPAAPERRRFLTKAACAVGGTALAMFAVPFVGALAPSERARAAGAPVSVDISRLEPGQQITIKWRGKPVWVLRRTGEMLERLSRGTERLRDPHSNVQSQQPTYATNEYRAVRPDTLVLVGLCTHLGCVPTFRPDAGAPDLGAGWLGGYFCPCHGSRFDFAGRVFKGVPAPTNLLVPPHRFLDETSLEIGVGPGGAR